MTVDLEQKIAKKYTRNYIKLNKKLITMNFFEMIKENLAKNIHNVVTLNNSKYMLLDPAIRQTVRDRYMNITVFLYNNDLLTFEQLQILSYSLWLFHDYSIPYNLL